MWIYIYTYIYIYSSNTMYIYIYICSYDRVACPKTWVPGLGVGVGFAWNFQVLMQTIILLVHIEGMDWHEARCFPGFFLVLYTSLVPEIWAHFNPNFISHPFISPWQVYDAIEVFAGVATLSRCLQLGGFETATLEIQHWGPFMEKRKSKRLRKLCVGNPLDLLSPAGFAFLGLFWQFLCNKCMLWFTSIQHSNMFFHSMFSLPYPSS